MSIRSRQHDLFAVVAMAAIVAACTGGAVSAPSSTTGPASPGPAAADTYWLRMTTTQAIPPVNLFAVQPIVRITGGGIVVMAGPVPEIYPGPLVPSLLGRSITPAGQSAIVDRARALGLLTGQADFSGRNSMPGSVNGRIELTVDAQRVIINGDPLAHIECVTTPCEPEPGTPAAFGELWRMLIDLPAWLSAELGPEMMYRPPAYSLLVGPAPGPEQGLTQAPMDWPLDQAIGTFGGPVANGTARCGTIDGGAADTLRPALEAANQLTQWVQDPETSATFGLVVRPLVPGEDACRDIFGLG